MTISEQIKVLCVRSDISVAELARRIGTTPQNFNGKMKKPLSFFAKICYYSVAELWTVCNQRLSVNTNIL